MKRTVQLMGSSALGREDFTTEERIFFTFSLSERTLSIPSLQGLYFSIRALFAALISPSVEYERISQISLLFSSQEGISISKS